MSKELGGDIGRAIQLISDRLWELELNKRAREPYEFDMDTVSAATKIFSAVIFDKVYIQTLQENFTTEQQSKIISGVGSELREFILKNTSIDSRDLFKGKK